MRLSTLQKCEVTSLKMEENKRKENTRGGSDPIPALFKFHKITAEGTFYRKLKGSVLTAGNQSSSHSSSPANSASHHKFENPHVAIYCHLVSIG